MGLSGIILILVLLAVLAFYIVATVKAAKNWGWVHVTTLYFMFFASLIFLVSSAFVFRNRVAWLKLHDQEAARNLQLEKEVQQLKFGDLEKTGNDPNSLTAVMNAFARINLDRGRIWKNARLDSIDNNGAQFSLTLPPQGDQSGPLPEGIVVYAFAEIQMEDGRVVAGPYIGQFMVGRVQGQAAALLPQETPTETQVNLLRSGEAAVWSLFELMPIDSHKAFVAEGSQPSDEWLFGRMDLESVAKLLQIDPASVEMTEGMFPNGTETDPNFRKASLLRSYMMDGSRTTEPLPPEFEWIKVEFTAEQKIDVESKESRVATEGGFFDLSGRTVDARLKQGFDQGVVTYRPGDRAALPKQAAEDLISQGVARLIDRYFVRPLNDYQLGFRELKARIFKAGKDIELYTQEVAKVDATNRKGQEQIALRQAERQKLDLDLAQFTRELEMITAENERLSSEIQAVNDQIRETRSQILKEHAKLIATSNAISTPAPAGN